MILQRLAEHYDLLEAEGKVQLAPPGYSQQKISFCVVIEPDGRLVEIQDERQLEGKTMRPRTMIVPGQAKPPGSGLNPCFLWDNAEYLLGWSADPAKAKRAPKAFAESKRMHLALEDADKPPAYAAVCAFLRGWSPEQAAAQADRLAEIATHFGVFRVAGEQKYVHEQVDAPGSAAQEAEAEALAHCLVTGAAAPSARLHEPKIKGVTGAQTAGALLVSFNATAFESYGKDQGTNAPVSVGTVFRYTNALNHLLAQPKRRIALGDATIVFWADRAETELEDAFAELFSGSAGAADDAPEEDRNRVDQTRVFLTQLRDGTRNTLAPKVESRTRFYILGLSPNASRLSVRLWIDADTRELEERLSQHLRDLELKGARDDRPLSVRALTAATGRYDPKGKSRFDTTNVSPQLAGELARSVLTGAPYPQSFLATMIRRIRSDSYVGHERVSAVKACLVRSARLHHQSQTFQEIPMELDEQRASLAYRCGRIFAVLERAQEASVRESDPNAKLNATIKDRYFGAAAATPLLVLPRLLVLNGHHLRKLKDGSKSYFNRLLGSIMEAQPFSFPRQLDLQQQGDFIIGYFQQRQEFFKGSTNKADQAQPEEAANE